jgi:hypothetical protein
MLLEKLEVGMTVNAHNFSDGYYTGMGKIVDIQPLKTAQKPNSPVLVRMMVCVKFSGKGCIWFEPDEIISIVN